MINNYLVITPKYGLCNQLLSISKGIILGIISKRNIIFKSFQLDYRNDNIRCDFHDVIDIDHLKSILTKKNIDISIHSKNINCKKIITYTNKEISYINDFIPILTYNCNINEQYLDIENPISCTIPNEYIDLYNHININIKFTDKYTDISNTIKKNLNLVNYSVIHLRLEDDSINFLKSKNEKLTFDEINKIYIEKYTKEIDIIKNINISNITV